MSSAPAKKSRLLDFALILAVAFLLTQAATRLFFPSTDPVDPLRPVMLSMQDEAVRYGGDPTVIVENRGQAQLNLPSRCPLPPFDVYAVGADGTLTQKIAEEAPVDCQPSEPVPAGDKATVSLRPWKFSLFAEQGTYELKLPLGTAGSGAVTGTGGAVLADSSVRFSVHEPGMFVKLFRAIIMKPMLNALILLGSWLPGHNLGLAIILLTILVKLVLFYPTQKALEGQKKMQLLQPKLEEVRKKHADDPARQQQEVMKLWKEHKINPLQSCLPLLLQFPVLIGLFYVIKEGSVLEGSRHLIYPAFQHVDWMFETMFLGLDLTKPSLWIFPPLLVVLQFLQMKLSFYVADKKKAKQIEKIEHGGVKTAEKTAQDVQQKVMQYALPLLIGFFALRFPAAVAVYWGVSTLFAIGQQIIVNREHIRP
jgi:YidC/Oxa1 family membrane protein insertase